MAREASDPLRGVSPEARRAAFALAIQSLGGEIRAADTCPRCGGCCYLVRVVLPGVRGSAAVCADCRYRAYAQKDTDHG